MRRILLIVLLFVACRPDDDESTHSQTIRGDASCRDCRIELREVALLGDSLDRSSPRPDAAGRECMVGRFSNGEYVVSALIGGGQLNVYSPSGTLVRTIGRPGQGPGEFGAMVRFAIGPGDTLYVMDDNNLRIQVLAPNGNYIRSFPTLG